MQHERHRVPVTAVAFWRQDVVLAGEGSMLNAYHVRSKDLLASVNIFDGQAIHGIIIIISDANDGRALVWGGRYVRALKLSQDEDERTSVGFKLGGIAEASDWILDAAFSHSNSDGISRAAIVTAHSALTIASIDHALVVCLEQVVPGSNCILYTAHVTWLSPFKCLIASGTAFGDIIVWSAGISVHDGKHAATWQTHYTFSAHDGSVFGVQIASGEVATALGLEKHVLASCSDDRTIRLWDISDLSSRSPTIAETQRETGFGSKPMDEVHTPLCIAKVMGHISRIWHVRFLYDAQGANSDHRAVRLASFGEDATWITWSFRLQNDSSVRSKYVLQHEYTERPHTGKNIWSVAHEGSRIAVGAADGAISIRDVSGINAAEQRKSLTIPPKGCETKSDMIRSYAFTSARELLAIYDQGNIVRLFVDTDGASQFVGLSASYSDAVRGYSVCTSSDHSAGFFAGMKGNVFVYDAVKHQCYEIAKTERKVVGLFSQRIASDGEEGHALLVTNIGLQSALCLQLSFKNGKEMTRVSSKSLILPDKSFVVTSFAQHDIPGCSLAILGSRSGSIAIYNLNVGTDRDSLDALCCVSIHGKEAVTSLKVLATPHGDDINILSTGRDGTFAVHEFKRDPVGAVQLTSIHQLLLPFGPSIEGQGCINDHLWVWGFKSKSFVVYDITSQREIMNVECGGVHRNWAFEPATNGGTFVWTQASNLYYQRQTSLPFDLLNSGGHGREIKTMATSPTKAGLLIATGAEDTNIKLWLLRTTEDGHGTWRCLHTLSKHNTGLQHLWLSQDGTYLFSSGGSQEFFIWRIRYDIPNLAIGILCESTHPHSGTSDLRITSFAVQEETENFHFRITMVFSDSSIQTWQYNPHRKIWSFLTSSNYLTSCLTQCLFLSPSSSQVLIASTDGHIAISARIRHKIHQNAILSMTTTAKLANDHLDLIITGGDDNAIGLTILGDDDDDGMKKKKKKKKTCVVVPRAHAAAVTALAVVGGGGGKEEDGGFWLVTAGVDQRVKIWEIEVDEGIGIKVKLLQERFTAVADVSCMEAARLEDGQIGIVLCGVGMDVWRIEKEA
ncbi:hypothetical protein AC578_4593 [Pseudocercospora eumusae]|uniref:Uncharacterized protein n=1 Tax=Pseudocercospora eumusae TaxID=321146 RepID=A0A139H562_9PEZI|nr:hypothetical protein AC578_4593 [Pseudocercospora eumusae]